MMKKFIACLILFMLAFIAGCGSGGTSSVPAASSNEESAVITPSINFVARYIRTDGYHPDVTYPASTTINSLNELDDYISINRNHYDLANGFLDAVDRYDDAYFADRILLLVLLEEGSGSISHTVTGVTQSESQTLVTIKRNVPGPGVDGTSDMAQWHIMIELKKDAYNGKPVNVKFE